MKAPSASVRCRTLSLWCRTVALHAFAFVVLPSLPYALLMLDYELRPREPFIFLYWLVGICARRPWVVGCAMATVACLDLVWLVSGLLFLHPVWVVQALLYLPLISPAAHWLYLAMVAATLTTIMLPTYFAYRAPSMFRWRLLSACLMAAAVVAELHRGFADFAENSRPAKASSEFDSAMRQAGIERSDAVEGQGSLLVVMIEGLGVFSDPAHGERVHAPLRSAEIESRYHVRRGSTRYAGSTTGATSRELCGRWGTYKDFLVSADFDCLPRRLRARGYETFAVHAFTGHMFDRFEWWPKIGFEHLLFEEQMRARGVTARCGIVFPSACDRVAADIVRDILTDVSDRPRLVYWLTVDSHMPVNPADGTVRWNCATGGPFGNRTVCQMAQIWADVLEATARIAANPDLRKATTILITGDHPPIATRRYFERGTVPWVVLEPLPQEGSRLIGRVERGRRQELAGPRSQPTR